jgi:hypothetical protein
VPVGDQTDGEVEEGLVDVVASFPVLQFGLSPVQGDGQPG